MKNTQKGSIVIWIVVIMIIIIGGGLYFYYQNKTPSQTPVTQTIDSNPIPTSPVQQSSNRTSTATWKSCSNSKYGYVAKYPSTWVIVEVGSGGLAPSSCEQSINSITFAQSVKGGGQISVATEDKAYMNTTVYKGCNSLEECTGYDTSRLADHEKNSSIQGYNRPYLVYSLPNRPSTIDGEKILWNPNDTRWFYTFHNGVLFDLYAAGTDDKTISDFISCFKF